MWVKLTHNFITIVLLMIGRMNGISYLAVLETYTIVKNCMCIIITKTDWTR